MNLHELEFFLHSNFKKLSDCKKNLPCNNNIKHSSPYDITIPEILLLFKIAADSSPHFVVFHIFPCFFPTFISITFLQAAPINNINFSTLFLHRYQYWYLNCLYKYSTISYTNLIQNNQLLHHTSLKIHIKHICFNVQKSILSYN